MSGNVFSDPRLTSVGASSTPDALRVRVTSTGAEFVLGVDGDADLATAPLLGQALAAAANEDHARVVLDLTGLQFIDAHCLGVISNAHCLLREQERVLVLRSAPRMVRRLLTICEMDALIEA